MFPSIVYSEKNKNKKIWVNVGAGVYTEYKKILKGDPKHFFLHIDMSFIYCILSKRMYGSPNTMYVCSDVSMGLPLKSNIATFITFFDSLPFMTNQKKLIEESQRVFSLKKEVVFFATAMVNHVYLPLSSLIFPVSFKLIQSFFKGGELLYLSDRVLAANIIDGKKETLLKDLKVINNNFFRFHIFWTNKYLSTSKTYNFSQMLEKKKREHKKLFWWHNHKITWKNKIY
jgi:hypothetical protein